MSKKNDTSILASFATLKILNDVKKYNNSYQILADFIGYIICTQNLYSFTSIEMKNKLNNVFLFDIPEAVVKTALKCLEYVHRKNNVYIVDNRKIIYDDFFEEKKTMAENTNSTIVDMLSAYVKEKNPEKEINLELLIQDFIAFLIEDQHNSTGIYTDLIGEFVLKNEKDVNIQKSLCDIQEGSILYLGLNHNIQETGSLTKNLTLFLGTEVLFGLVGFNGEIYRQLAIDFYDQVKNANVHGKKIQLCYFSEIKDEIDSFFDSAKLIVEGKIPAFEKVAMKAIINHCASASDVAVKKADFYHCLQYGFGIIEDIGKDYYNHENNEYNLEDAQYTEPQEQESWRYISHINKLRKGNIFSNNTEAEYLFITNTRATLNASRMQTDKVKMETGLEQVNDYAVSINRITNILWYKLGNGFGRKEYPNNVNAVLKAKIVLASSISHNVAEVYNNAKEQYKNGKITKTQLAARIIVLRKKPVLPEELEVDCIEESMDFSTEFICRFEEEVILNKATLEERELKIQKMEENQIIQLVEKDKEIAQKDQIIYKQNEENMSLVSELQKYKEKEEERRRRKELLKKSIRLGLCIIWKIMIIVVVTVLVYALEQKFNNNIPKHIYAIVDSIGVLGVCWVAIKKDYSKIFNSTEFLDEE